MLKSDFSKAGSRSNSAICESIHDLIFMQSDSCFLSVSAFKRKTRPFSDPFAAISSASASHPAKCRRIDSIRHPAAAASRSTFKTRRPSPFPNRNSRRASLTSGVFIYATMPDRPPLVKPAAQDDARPILSPENENTELARPRKPHHLVPDMPCHPPPLELPTIGATRRKCRRYVPPGHATRQPYSHKGFPENWHMT